MLRPFTGTLLRHFQKSVLELDDFKNIPDEEFPATILEDKDALNLRLLFFKLDRNEEYLSEVADASSRRLTLKDAQASSASELSPPTLPQSPPRMNPDMRMLLSEFLTYDRSKFAAVVRNGVMVAEIEDANET